MTYAGLAIRVKSHFENCNNGPEETPVQGDCSYILTPRATGAVSPAGAVSPPPPPPPPPHPTTTTTTTPPRDVSEFLEESFLNQY